MVIDPETAAAKRLVVRGDHLFTNSFFLFSVQVSAHLL